MSIKKFIFGLAALALIFGVSGAVSAQTMTVDQLMAQIAQLTAQIGALQGGGSMSADIVPMPPLTVGNSGMEVTKLQQWLMSQGYAIPAGATGTFGPQTKAALAKWQGDHGVAPAVGYYGNITYNAIMATTGGTYPPVNPGPGSSSNTCPNGNLLSNNCMPAQTGTTCPNGNLLSNNCMPSTGGGTTPDTGLTGSTGVVENYTLMSDLTNEPVGEDEDDVPVIGLEVEADNNSDLELTAVRVVFNESTNTTSDFEDYATEVSVWLDGEEVGRVDSTGFTDENNWTKTIALDDGAIIKAGETAELTIAVSAVSNLDSSDDDPDSWTADITSVRYVDGRGDSTSEDPGTGTRTFNFKSFASAADSEFKITEDDDAINKFHIAEISTTDTKQDVELASFTLEAEGDSALEIKKLGVMVTITGDAVDVDDVIA
ncbi:MAG: peptidoglycan-binding protein, partial [Patescibacteria group bacterium]